MRLNDYIFNGKSCQMDLWEKKTDTNLEGKGGWIYQLLKKGDSINDVIHTIMAGGIDNCCLLCQCCELSMPVFGFVLLVIKFYDIESGSLLVPMS